MLTSWYDAMVIGSTSIFPILTKLVSSSFVNFILFTTCQKITRKKKKRTWNTLFCKRGRDRQAGTLNDIYKLQHMFLFMHLGWGQAIEMKYLFEGHKVMILPGLANSQSLDRKSTALNYLKSVFFKLVLIENWSAWYFTYVETVTLKELYLAEYTLANSLQAFGNLFLTFVFKEKNYAWIESIDSILWGKKIR